MNKEIKFKKERIKKLKCGCIINYDMNGGFGTRDIGNCPIHRKQLLQEKEI